MDIELATVFFYLTKRPVRGEIKHIAERFEDDLFTPFILCRPRRLDAKGRLEISLRRGGVAQHQNAGPRLHGDARRKFSAGKGDGLGLLRVFHRIVHRLYCLGTHPRLIAGSDNDLIIIIEMVAALL